MKNKIYIGNLHESVRKNELRDEFDKFGEISDLFLNTGFAHLTFLDSRSASDAIRLMDGVVLFGNKLRVEMSQDSQQRYSNNYHRHNTTTPNSSSSYPNPHPPRRNRYSPDTTPGGRYPGGPERDYRGGYRGGPPRGGSRSSDLYPSRRSSPPQYYGGRPGHSPPPSSSHRREDYYSNNNPRRNSPPPRYRSRSPIPSHRYSSSHSTSSSSHRMPSPRSHHHTSPQSRNFSSGSDREYRGRGGRSSSYGMGEPPRRYEDDCRGRDYGSRHSERGIEGRKQPSHNRDSRSIHLSRDPPRSNNNNNFDLPIRDSSRSFSRSSREGGGEDMRRFRDDYRSTRGGGPSPPSRGAPRSRGRFIRGH